MTLAIPSLLLAALLPLVAPPRSDTTSTEPRPDVLFVAVDDLSDWVGCLKGHPDAHTPNIDRLAERGVLFTHAYCVSPICGPSRASVLTGQRPETTGVYTNRGTYIDHVPDAVSLPRRMQQHGYRVLGAGKVNHGLGLRIPEDWHEYGPGSGVVGSPFTDEELRCEGMLPAREVRRDGWRCTLPMNGGLSMIDRPTNQWDTFDWGPLDAPDEEFPDAQVAAWGARQLALERDQPLFLAIGIYKPHQPFFVPREYFERFPAGEVRLPPTLAGDLHDVPAAGRDLALRPWTSGTHRTVVEHDAWREAVAAYLATIAFADAQVGVVVDALQRPERAGDTWIVLWSDHGWSLGQKEHWGKHDPWRSSLRVPLIVVPPAGRTPEGFRPGTVCEAPVSLLDLYPTVLDACDLPVPDELEGRSLLPLLRDPRAPWPEAVVSTVGRGTHSVSTPEWRYVRYFDGSEELYELESDPEEWFNRAGDPELAEVRERLASYTPRDGRVLRYVRRGRWKCVLRADGTANLFDLHAPMGISEQDDLAAEHPEVVAEIRAQLEQLGVHERFVSLPDPDELETARLIEKGVLLDTPLRAQGTKATEGLLRLGGRKSKLLFGRAPGEGPFSLRVSLRIVDSEGESAAVRLGPNLFGLRDASGRIFLEGPLFEGLASPGALDGFVDSSEEFLLELERAAGRLRFALAGREVLTVPVPPGERFDLLGLLPGFCDLRVREATLAGERLEAAHWPSFTIPQLDLDQELELQTIVDRDPEHYLGHPSSVLLEDGRTMIMMYLEGHARASLRWVRSEDGGRSWQRQAVPDGWNEKPEGWETPFREVPILYRMTDPAGKERVQMFTGTWPIRRAWSEDDGRTWSALEPLGEGTFGGVVVFADMVHLSDGSYLATMHDDGRFLRHPPAPRRAPKVYVLRSRDGGMSWTDPEVAVEHPVAHLCEAGLIPSPDGRRIAMLMRENSRAMNSYISFSDDEGKSWSTPRQMPAALTGDRHQEVYAPDGRLLISFRDTGAGSPTQGDWVGWVGTFEDLELGREGEYRVRFKDNLQGSDCAYPTMERFPDDSLFTATYGHWEPGERPFIVGFHFRLEELDALLDGGR